jgi:coiled-coil domain-containing protein 55
MHAAALAEDASVFDYDSHFDSIQETRAEPKQKEKMARESRYIASLLETAEERKREQEVLYERQLAKERAAEDHLYGDKEKFVTAAYKKKLEEEAKWKAEQKQKQVDEEQNAVEKKGHMGDFYRNILRNNVAFGTAEKAVVAEKPAAGQKQKQAVKEGGGGDDDIMPERRAQMEVRAGGAKKEQAVPRQPSNADATDKAREMDKKEDLIDKKSVEEKQQEGRVENSGAAGTSRKEEERETGAAVDQAAEAAAAQAAALVSKKSREDAVAAARERYLARKRKADNLS